MLEVLVNDNLSKLALVPVGEHRVHKWDINRKYNLTFIVKSFQNIISYKFQRHFDKLIMTSFLTILHIRTILITLNTADITYN